MTTLITLDSLEGVQTRTATVEKVDADAGTILMRAAPYGVETRIGPGLFESFEPGTFAGAAAAPHRVKLWHEHDGPLIGHAAAVEDKPDAVWVRAKFANTLAGQEARELARDGTIDQVSVEFQPRREWFKATRLADGLHVRHSKATLLGVALVAHGAYLDESRIVSVRDHDAARRAEAAEERRLARLAALDALMRRM